MLKRITRHNGICDDERSRGQGEEKDTVSHYHGDRQRLQLFKENSLKAPFFKKLEACMENGNAGRCIKKARLVEIKQLKSG